MVRLQRKNAFSLALHRLALSRLRERPDLLGEAMGVIERWRLQAGGAAHCAPYWSEWELLLQKGVDAVAVATCVDTDGAATLRSMSPLGRFIEVAERDELLRKSLAA